MTKLDEIEARLDTVIGLRPEDEDLLIRAVRQLGPVVDWADFVAIECESGVIETESDGNGLLSRAHHDKRIAKGIRRHLDKIEDDVLELVNESD